MKNSCKLLYSTIFFVFLLVKSTSVARAAEPFSSLAIGPLIGTTGIGVQFSTPFWPKYINLNFGYSYFSIDSHASTNNEPWREKCNFGGAPIFLSAYPVQQYFHFDLGIFISQNNIDMTTVANPHATYTLHDHTYLVPDYGKISGGTHFNRIDPYIGIGWGNPFFGGKWTFTANAGVILEGGAKTKLTATNNVPGIADNLRNSQESFNGGTSFMNAFPVVNIGLTYRF